MTAPLFEIRDTSDVPLSLIEITATAAGITSLGTIRAAVVDAWAGATAGVGVMTPDGMPASAGTVRGMAGTAVDGHWVEAKIGAGAWTPIGGHLLDAGAATLAVSDPSPADYVDIELRLNVPTTAELGAFAVFPFVFWYR